MAKGNHTLDYKQSSTHLVDVERCLSGEGLLDLVEQLPVGGLVFNGDTGVAGVTLDQVAARDNCSRKKNVSLPIFESKYIC